MLRITMRDRSDVQRARLLTSSATKASLPHFLNLKIAIASLRLPRDGFLSARGLKLHLGLQPVIEIMAV